MVLTFKSVDIILQCDHSNEISLAVFSHGTVYYAAKGGILTLESGQKLSSVTIQMKATEQYFLIPVVLFIMLCKVVLPFETKDKICAV